MEHEISEALDSMIMSTVPAKGWDASYPAFSLSRKALPALLLDTSGEAASPRKVDCLGSALGGLGF